MGVGKLSDALVDQVERGSERGSAVARRQLFAAPFDGPDLGLDQIVNPTVGADLAQPRNSPTDDLGAAANRRNRLMQVPAGRLGGRRPCLEDGRADRHQNFGRALFGNVILGGEIFLDPRHRVEHHAGIGVAVAPGVFGEEPAAARRLHEGFADRVVVGLARKRGTRGDRREGESFVGH